MCHVRLASYTVSPRALQKYSANAWQHASARGRSHVAATGRTEAEALARQYPELLPKLPKKPPIWKSEPRRLVLFEALALALRIKETR